MGSKLLVRMSDVEPLAVRWAWEGFVPMGRLSMITGGPGVGKSFVALQIAAMMTRGVSTLEDRADADREAGPDAEMGPDLAGGDQSSCRVSPRFTPGGIPRGVLVLSAADDLQETVLPRLIAAGADPSLVFCLKGMVQGDEHHSQSEGSPPYSPDRAAGSLLKLESGVSSQEEVSLPTQTNGQLGSKMRFDSDDPSTKAVNVRPFRLSQDMQRLSGCLRELSATGIDVGLIVIDSIDHYIGANEKKSDRIELVAQLADLAARSQAALLVTANTSMKTGSRGGTVVYQELFNVARSVLMVTEDREMAERRQVVSLKHNLTSRPDVTSFVIEDGAIRWDAGWAKKISEKTLGGGSESLDRKVVTERHSRIWSGIRECRVGEEVHRQEIEVSGRDSQAWTLEPLVYWAQGENTGGDQVTQLVQDRTLRESNSKKRDLRRRERRARRASQRRNRR